MWPSILSDRLLIVALVGLYLTNRLISRGLILYHYRFSHRKMPPCELMRFYHKFLYAIPRYKADYPRVTHPSATRIFRSNRSLPSIPSFDLHVLSVPPAFILSQDQTLILKFVRTLDSLSRFLHPCITVFRIDMVIFLPSLPTETISGSQYWQMSLPKHPSASDVTLFDFQSSDCRLADRSCALLKAFAVPFARRPIYNTTQRIYCQHLFKLFSKSIEANQWMSSKAHWLITLACFGNTLGYFRQQIVIILGF